ncbi:pantetheine-phosphate adenylyltransferase [Lactobacillus sp. PV037]|uniref:pantetheine-phosphate adenylyltransferase n=1 Tax=unclassified Lactobacillus TaxID=2620435 RepID=UPI00223FD9E3|nr:MULTISPECIES: pantetheine-phosphate adenylyltransferase [unclassified Lactobacillus]QNQ82435.1 pantetheine-phosphate adenylyltransferase [Lactobacillus sp. PV012]QNQ83452.1 pantetheine-phosphate adenylyltransferase [Lactobacillus sp. PV037]
MVKAIFPGSFDPVTNGHVETAKIASSIFDEVYFVIMTNTNKKYLFSEQERVTLAKQIFSKDQNIHVISRPADLTVKVAEELGADAIVRGLRNDADFNYEREIAAINKSLAPDLNTVLLLTSPENSFISSSMIKETVTFGGDVSKLVPSNVVTALNEKLKND